MHGFSVIEKLKGFPWDKYGVLYAVLFGSASRGEFYHDIDIALKFRKYSYEHYLDILESLSKYLGVREDHIDIVILNRDDIPCQLLVDIFSKGTFIHINDLNELINDVLRRVNPCIDFLISLRKTRYFERMLKAVKENWE